MKRNRVFHLLLAVILIAVVLSGNLQPVRGSGGPDNGGYIYDDSNDPGGPVYNWEDMTSGTSVSLANDAMSGPIDMGFDFQFYGQTYRNVYISSNGFITFTGGQDSANAAGTIPDATAPNNIIAAWWANLNPSGNGTIRYLTRGGSTGPHVFVIEFFEIHRNALILSYHVSFQIKLFEGSNNIEIHYRDTQPNGDTTTAGIENADGSAGLMYYNGADSLTTPIAVRYSIFTGVAVRPVQSLVYGAPGTTATHHVRIANWTGAPDNFTVAASTSAWAPSIPITETGEMANGQSLEFDITVPIPPEAVAADYDTFTLTVTSTLAPSPWTGEAALTTAVPRRGYIFNQSEARLDIVDTKFHNNLGETIDASTFNNGFIMGGSLAPNGHELWSVASGDGASVWVVNIENLADPPVRIDVGADPSRMAFNDDGSLALVSNYGAGTVSVINTAARSVIGTVTVGSQPVQVGTSACLRKAYIANSASNTVSVIDLDSLTVPTTISGFNKPWTIVVSPTAPRAYVINQNSKNVQVINTQTDTVISTWNINGSTMDGADISPDGQWLYVASTDQVKVVNTATGAYTDINPGVTNMSEARTFPADKGSFAYFSSSANKAIAVMDTSTNKIIKTIPIDGNPNGMALFPPSTTCVQAPIARFDMPPNGIGHLNEPMQFVDRSFNAPTPATTYDWNFGDGSEHSSVRSPQHTYTVAGTYTVTLTLTRGTETSTASGTVNFAPRAAYTQTATVIHTGESVTFSNQTTGNEPMSYRWQFGDGTEVTVSTRDDVAHQYNTAGDYTVTMTATNDYGSDQRTSKVDFAPLAAFTPTDIITQTGTPITFNNQSTGTEPMNYAWDFGDGSTSTVRNPQHTYTTAGNYSVLLTVTNGYGDPATASTTVSFRPRPDFTPLHSAIHAGDAIQFTSNSTGSGELTYLWDFGDGSPDATSTDPNPSHTYNTIGSYTVRLSVTNSISTEYTEGTVNFLPVADFTQDASVININDTVHFTNHSTGTAPLDYTWDFGDNTAVSHEESPNHQYTAAGNYTVTLTAHNTIDGVSRTSTKTSTVEFYPHAAFSPTSSNIQLGTAITFTNQSTGSTPMYYSWDFNDGAVSTETSPTHTYTAAANYTVRLTVSDKYGNSSVAEGTVVFRPKASFTPVDSIIYPGDTVNFHSTSTGNNLSYAWTFGDGGTSTIQNPSHTYPTAGNYTVRLTVTNPNGSDYMDGTVLFYPTAEFTPLNSVIDVNNSISFTNQSTGSTPLAYDWYFGDGSPVEHGLNPTHQYTTAGNYTVTLTTHNNVGGSDRTSTRTGTVRFHPAASFTSSGQIKTQNGNLVIQQGGTLNFTNTSTGSTPINYTWNFGDGGTSTATNGSHTYNTVADSYPVTLSASSDWGTSTASATVVFAPTPRFTPTSSTIVTGGSVTFTNQSVGSGTLTYDWNFGDGSPVEHGVSPTHQYNTAGDYTVTLTAHNTYGDYSTTGRVLFAPTAGFTPVNSVITVGTDVHFTNTSTGTNTGSYLMTYTWDFGDGATSTEASPSHRYNTAGAYTVRLTAHNGLGNDSIATGTIRFSPTARFTPTDLQIQTGDTVQFQNQSVGTAPLSYLWDFGDGSPTSTDTNPQHQYTVAGSYTVRLTVSNAYQPDSTFTTTVVFKPRAIMAPAFSRIHVNEYVDFTSSSTGTGTLTYLWTFGDGATSTERNPRHTYTVAGDYTVTLKATNSLGDDTTTGRVVFSPTARFSADRTIIHLGDAIHFTNQSTGTAPLTYTWNFGDGSPVSHDVSPTYTYSTIGSYTVTLTVENRIENQTETATASTLVTFYPVAAFTPDQNIIKVGDTIYFTNQSTGTAPLTYVWNFGDGSPTENGVNASHTYNRAGDYTVTLTASNHNGQYQDTHTGRVRFAPVAAFSPNPVITRLGQPIQVSNLSTGTEPLTYTWNFGDGTPVSHDKIPVHTYAAVGVYDLTLTVSNTITQTPATTTAKVYFAPVAGFIPSTYSILPGDTVTFSNTSTGGGILSYTWDFGDGSPVSYEANPVHSFPREHRTYQVKLTVVNDYGSSEYQAGILVEQFKIYLPFLLVNHQ